MANPKLYILTEQYRDKSLELAEDNYTIGRVDTNDIQIPDSSISSRHCVLVRVPTGGYTLADSGSTNGTTINEKLIGADPVQLNNGDILTFGSVEAMYEHREAGKTQTTIHQSIVIDLNKKTNTEVVTAEMRNLGKRVNTKSSLDLKARNRQNRMMMLIIGIMVLCAVLVAIKVTISIFR